MKQQQKEAGAAMAERRNLRVGPIKNGLYVLSFIPLFACIAVSVLICRPYKKKSLTSRDVRFRSVIVLLLLLLLLFAPL